MTAQHLPLPPSPHFPCELTQPCSLLGGLSPAVFMRRHWQKKPLLIRQGLPGVVPPVDLADLIHFAQQDSMESRLIQRNKKGWQLHSGPLAQAQTRLLSKPASTLLVHGVDRYSSNARKLMSLFRFIPDARLDDLMVSYASDGGGVGPHFDSYDVFLVQVLGRRRWQISRPQNYPLLPDTPLKILSHFEAEQEWVLEPGDILYLPPRWAHNGVAEGNCMTCSVGFRAPSQDEFAQEVLQRVLDAQLDLIEQADEAAQSQSARGMYRDPKQAATTQPAKIPPSMHEFAQRAIARLLAQPSAQACALGEWLSEPALNTWFEEGKPWQRGQSIFLDDRTRMLYDERHIFINGESYRTSGRDARLMRKMADHRYLPATQILLLSEEALNLLCEWTQAGWLLGRA